MRDPHGYLILAATFLSITLPLGAQTSPKPVERELRRLERSQTVPSLEQVRRELDRSAATKSERNTLKRRLRSLDNRFKPRPKQLERQSIENRSLY